MLHFRPPPEVARQLETGVWLQGAGSYVQVVSSLIEGSSPILLSLEFRTFSSDGFLVSLYSENMDQVRCHVISHASHVTSHVILAEAGSGC